jgi:hypothetical protein
VLPHGPSHRACPRLYFRREGDTAATARDEFIDIALAHAGNVLAKRDQAHHARDLRRHVPAALKDGCFRQNAIIKTGTQLKFFEEQGICILL